MTKSSVWTGLFRGTATLGIGVILWLQQTYVPREKFEDYKDSHEKWDEQVIKVIDDKLDRLTRGQESIERELRTIGRRQRERDDASFQKQP